MSFTVRSASLPAPSPFTLPPRSLTTTFAPCFASSSACPRPMPCPAPVTIAIFPSNSPIRCPCLVRRSWSGLRVAVAELELHDLAGGVPGQCVHQLELLGELLLHQPALEQ